MIRNLLSMLRKPFSKSRNLLFSAPRNLFFMSRTLPLSTDMNISIPYVSFFHSLKLDTYSSSLMIPTPSGQTGPFFSAQKP